MKKWKFWLIGIVNIVFFARVVFSADGLITEYSIPTPSSNPVDIAVDASDNIWFTEQNSNKLGRFIPSTQTFEEFDIPYKEGSPAAIVVDVNSVIWAALSADNSIISFSPAEKKFKRYK